MYYEEPTDPYEDTNREDDEFGDRCLESEWFEDDCAERSRDMQEYCK